MNDSANRMRDVIENVMLSEAETSLRTIDCTRNAEYMSEIFVFSIIIFLI